MTNPVGTPNDRSTLAPSLAGHVSEMFCSVQGEGLFVGERQIFLRTAGCSATCSWCDTVYSKVQTPRFVVHSGGDAGSRWRPNPVSVDTVVADVVDFARDHAPVSTVSITGGEPLEQAGFVGRLARGLRGRGFRIYLETAGIHGDALRPMLDDLDVIAMDIKLPSATGVEHWDAHRDFLAAVRGTTFVSRDASDAERARSLFVKVIVDLEATLAEIERAARLIAETSPAIPLILQPESETLFGRNTTRDRARALLDRVDAGSRVAGSILQVVRVIPQTHKVLHVR
jgi:7-carboxy-7-deazaguanine synthase